MNIEPDAPPGKVTRYDLFYGRIRSIVLTLSGLGLIAHQTLIATSAQPFLLLTAAALLGIPLALGFDKQLK